MSHVLEISGLVKTFGGSQIYHGIRPLFDED